MRIGVAATPDVAIPTLNWLLQSEHEIALIITQPDRPAGRGQILQQTAVAEWAKNHQIPVVKPERSQELVGTVEELDLVLTIGYGVLLPDSAHQFYLCLKKDSSICTSHYFLLIEEPRLHKEHFIMEK